MCGRFTQQRPTAELAELFEAEPLVDDPGGHFNLAPTDPATVVVERDDRRALTTYRWGLLPHWSPDPRAAARRINARAETVATSPVVRRLLPPAPLHRPGRRLLRMAARRHGPPAVLSSVGATGQPLALAGLWSGWHDPLTDAVRRTFTIVTTTPNEPIAELHDRMPVILEPADWGRWLAPRAPTSASSTACSGRRPTTSLEIVPVGPLVNNVRNDGPELIRPARRLTDLSRGRAPSRPALAAAARAASGGTPRSSSAASRPTIRAKTPSGSSAGASITIAPRWRTGRPRRAAAARSSRRRRRPRRRRRWPAHPAVERLGDDDHGEADEVAERQVEVAGVEGGRNHRALPRAGG